MLSVRVRDDRKSKALYPFTPLLQEFRGLPLVPHHTFGVNVYFLYFYFEVPTEPKRLTPALWSFFRGSFITKFAWVGFRMVAVDKWSLLRGGC